MFHVKIVYALTLLVFFLGCSQQVQNDPHFASLDASTDEGPESLGSIDSDLEEDSETSTKLDLDCEVED